METGSFVVWLHCAGFAGLGKSSQPCSTRPSTPTLPPHQVNERSVAEATTTPRTMGIRVRSTVMLGRFPMKRYERATVKKGLRVWKWGGREGKEFVCMQSVACESCGHVGIMGE